MYCGPEPCAPKNKPTRDHATRNITNQQPLMRAVERRSPQSLDQHPRHWSIQFVTLLRGRRIALYDMPPRDAADRRARLQSVMKAGLSRQERTVASTITSPSPVHNPQWTICMVVILALVIYAPTTRLASDAGRYTTTWHRAKII